MSIKLITKAFEVAGIDPATKLVLICLADAANDNGDIAWPSVKTIAAKCNVSDRTVHRHLGILRELDLIRVVEARPGRATKYLVTPDTCDTPEDLSPPKPMSDTYDTGGRHNRKEPLVINSRGNRFEEFWDAFADKRGRKPAFKAWCKNKLDAIADEVIDGAKKYALTRSPDGKGWKMAEGWLNDERWKDEPPILHSTNGTGRSYKSSKPNRHDDDMAFLAEYVKGDSNG